jgi:hypothetical protein
VLNIFIAILEEAYIISKMENKSHWIFDYMKSSYKDSNVPHNFVPKEKPNEPNKCGVGSFKNEKRHVTFSQQARSIGEAVSYEEPNLIKSKRFSESVFKPLDKDKVEKQIEEEFNTIDRNLDEIRLLSEKATRENSIIDSEVHDSVLSEITAIERRISEIRIILQKNY